MSMQAKSVKNTRPSIPKKKLIEHVLEENHIGKPNQNVPEHGLFWDNFAWALTYGKPQDDWSVPELAQFCWEQKLRVRKEPFAADEKKKYTEHVRCTFVAARKKWCYEGDNERSIGKGWLANLENNRFSWNADAYKQVLLEKEAVKQAEAAAAAAVQRAAVDNDPLRYLRAGPDAWAYELCDL